MNFFRVHFVILFLMLVFLHWPRVLLAEIKPKYGPAHSSLAISLAASNDFFRSKNNPAPDFWSMIGYYVPQINPYSCSAASVAMVLNAARAHFSKTADDQVISQKFLLEKIKQENWSERLSPQGANGAHGIDLDRLGNVILAAFKTNGFKKVSIKVVHIQNTSKETKAALLRVLSANEKSEKNYMIANFDQKIFTDDASVGHVSPVGAYDAQRGRVLILDPDREYYEPYWISVDTFLEGMATKDKGAGANRGYVLIELGQ